MGKGEIAHNEQFLLFPQCLLLDQIIVSPFVYIFDIISLSAAELEEPKIGISGKGLRHNGHAKTTIFCHLGFAGMKKGENYSNTCRKYIDFDIKTTFISHVHYLTRQLSGSFHK